MKKYLAIFLFFGLVGCSSEISRCIDAKYTWYPKSLNHIYPWSENLSHNLYISKIEKRQLSGANKLNTFNYYFLYGFEDLGDWITWERSYYKKREKELKQIARFECNAEGIY